MSLTHLINKKAEKRFNYQNATYPREVNLQQRNPLMHEATRQKCPLNCSKRLFLSLNSLRTHLIEHRVSQGIGESQEDFRLRLAQSFDSKKYVLSLCERLFNGEKL
jgi:hypothetical protein